MNEKQKLFNATFGSLLGGKLFDKRIKLFGFWKFWLESYRHRKILGIEKEILNPIIMILKYIDYRRTFN